MGQRNVKPIIIRGPAPEWSEKPNESPHERPGNADEESLGCGRHMSSRQTLEQIKREARARPKRHQPVPSQYRTWWGHGQEVKGKGGCGLVVGRGEKIYSRLLLKKERGVLVQRAFINRSASLSPPSKSYISPKTQTRTFPLGQ